jgi:hypothetical protein
MVALRHGFRVGILGITVGVCSLSGAVKLQILEGRPLVEGVYVNGHGPYRFLLDTGANVNLLDTNVARKIGMRTTFEDTVESSIGKVSLPGSDDNTIDLGDVRADCQKFQFSTLDTLHILSPNIQGVLGQQFLSGFDYLIDVRDRRLAFGKQAPRGNRTQSQSFDGRNAVSTSLGYLVLDSGAPGVVLFGVKGGVGDRRDMLTLTGSQSVGMVARRLAIEGQNVWRGDAVAIPGEGESGVAGLMPLSLFKAVYVCNSEGYIEFE